MNRTFFQSMLKIHGKTTLSYGFGMAAYMMLVIWVYPSIARSPALNTLLKSMPQGMLKLFGYQSGVSQVGDYLAGEFYGLIYVIILAIYTVIASTKLIAHLVDNGSMAYLLATPVSRTKIALTQAVQLIVGIIVIGICATASALLGVHWFVRSGGLDVRHFIEMNIVGMLLFLVIGSYSYVFSCLARDERTALSMSASLTL
ncbi:MAG: ABC transporter permease subunit, partial [Firmicutes bacterium]|nr:ABC transporter permease subunit [Bacillota bacterium]